MNPSLAPVRLCCCSSNSLARMMLQKGVDRYVLMLTPEHVVEAVEKIHDGDEAETDPANSRASDVPATPSHRTTQVFGGKKGWRFGLSFPGPYEFQAVARSLTRCRPSQSVWVPG